MLRDPVCQHAGDDGSLRALIVVKTANSRKIELLASDGEKLLEITRIGVAHVATSGHRVHFGPL